MHLQNKVAIITGAASGFGEATSKLFAKQGAKIVAVDFDFEKVQKVVDEINNNGGEAIATKADVSNAQDVKAFVDLAIKEYNQLDIIYNNAGIFIPGTAEEITEDQWDKVINVDLKSVFLGTKYALPHLKKTKGVIINTASAGGIIGFPQAVAYGAAKGGVISLTKATAVDYAADGIRANAICPGTGETGLTKEVLADENMQAGFLQPIPMKKFAQPDDIAKAALYLASDLSSYVTGTALPVDGGWTMS
ncbi:short-chain dehydrogenase [Companilactobacillus sp. RD055328]|uniref:SDR family NAD(P)-dependent oxidoreductase n=1 Tax=Companilactobacillus sp. RD055328 TaxID=2916634 RepID=UPI001FC84F63|nr:SDR family NAD(P)-dependent oxidoreductase [Companilactobacillus sp. RD055328]GKQ42348.1 short-chain dehydrogenase [Companilactobacillus sp. RD055328]